VLLSCILCTANANHHPAKELAASLRTEMPADPMKFVQDVLAAESQRTDTDGKAKILVVGDSWASVVGTEGPLPSFLERRLKLEHCNATTTSIAIPGTESGDWSGGALLAAMKVAAVGRDYVFIVLAGNDALDRMPSCAEKKKTAVQCGDELMAEATPNMYKIVDAIHEVNPKARVVGVGYDTMFGGWGCGLVTADIFPQCYLTLNRSQGNACFNTQFLRIQKLWDRMAANRTFVDSASILGATQVAGGDPAASTDPKDRHIDMDKMGPAKYWPDYEGCFHPGVFGGEDSGAMVVMEEFYKVYWSKIKGVCPQKEQSVVV